MSASNPRDLLILGNTVADVIVHPVDRFPHLGLSLHVDDARLAFGGCGANTAATSAKLGAPTRLYSGIGSDEIGQFVRQQLERRPRLDAAGVKSFQGMRTSLTLVLVQPGSERSFICYSGVSSSVDGTVLPADFPGDAALFHYAGFFLLPELMGDAAARLFKAAKVAGASTSLDVAWKESVDFKAAVLPCLPYLDCVMPNVEEACRISGESNAKDAALWFVDRGVASALITTGESGVYWARAGVTGFVPAFPVDVIDTTGAGDAFAGAFLAVTLDSLVDPTWEPLERRLRFASAAGALACTAFGGDEGVRSREQIFELMGQGG